MGLAVPWSSPEGKLANTPQPGAAASSAAASGGASTQPPTPLMPPPGVAPPPPRHPRRGGPAPRGPGRPPPRRAGGGGGGGDQQRGCSGCSLWRSVETCSTAQACTDRPMYILLQSVESDANTGLPCRTQNHWMLVPKIPCTGVESPDPACECAAKGRWLLRCAATLDRSGDRPGGCISHGGLVWFACTHASGCGYQAMAVWPPGMPPASSVMAGTGHQGELWWARAFAEATQTLNFSLAANATPWAGGRRCSLRRARASWCCAVSPPHGHARAEVDAWHTTRPSMDTTTWECTPAHPQCLPSPCPCSHGRRCGAPLAASDASAHRRPRGRPGYSAGQ